LLVLVAAGAPPPTDADGPGTPDVNGTLLALDAPANATAPVDPAGIAVVFEGLRSLWTVLAITKMEVMIAEKLENVLVDNVDNATCNQEIWRNNLSVVDKDRSIQDADRNVISLH
jgi:hypothetical protein